MLNHLKISLLLFLGLLITGCSSTKDLPQKTLFPFEYNDEAYQIISISSEDGEGMNFLLKVTDDTTSFRTLDQDQDGVIEAIQYGSITLAEANVIYQFGIQKAINDGKFKSREGERIFTYTEENFRFTIETFGFYTDLIYNEFTVLNTLDNTEVTFFDIDADGFLDRADDRDLSIQDYQSLYEKVLEEGLLKSRIEIKYDKYIAKFTATSHPS